MRTSSKTADQRPEAQKRAVTLIASFLFLVLSAAILIHIESLRSAPRSRERQSVYKAKAAYGSSPDRSTSTAPAADIAPATPPLPVGAVTLTAADFDTLSIKNLLIPVAGVAPGQLRDSFYDSRSEGRVHQALDIMAPHDTPVLASDDGKVLRLHQSDRGGIMLYQSDASGMYVYYYGHLTRYANGIAEGMQLRRGEVIAFVGDTGNAGPGNYHLHFGISKVTAPGKWSGGEPINPYLILADKRAKPSIGARN